MRPSSSELQPQEPGADPWEVITLTCPSCQHHLDRRRNRIGAYWACENCTGQAVMVPQVRSATDRGLFRQLWFGARPAGQGGVPCPSCQLGMGPTTVDADGGSLELDTCRRCQLVWFDPGEAEQVLQEPPAPAEETLSSEQVAARQTAVIAMVQLRGEQRKNAPPQDARSLFAAMGLPVEHKPEFLGVRPWATWIACATLALVFLMVGDGLPRAIAEYGFLPAEAGRGAGITLFTAFFLHAGWLHLLSNLYFLLVFGDDVEVALGRLKYLLLLIAGAVFGSLIHGVFTTSPTVPCIGASAGISAVLVFYAMAFPHHRIGLAALFGVRYWHVSARGALLFWLGTQVWGGFVQLAGLSAVSAWAHLGGAAVGFVTWWLWQRPGAATASGRSAPS